MFSLFCDIIVKRGVIFVKYKTNDLAKVLGVTTNTIRRYEKNGYITPDKSVESGYRSYTQGDIIKIGLIRLLRKCGFTHQEIESFEGKSDTEIMEIAQIKLNELDEKIQRLKFLRHWLKDNIQMIDACKNLGEGFTVMDCPPVYYVLYSEGEKLLSEKERLKTISDFMYAAPEVQSIMYYRQEDLKKGNILPNLGWVIKEMDIDRVGLHEMFENDKYILYYPMQKCVYGSFRYPSEFINDFKKQTPYTEDFKRRKEKFLNENNFCESGDIMMFFMGALGKYADWMVCIPVKEQ